MLRSLIAVALLASAASIPAFATDPAPQPSGNGNSGVAEFCASEVLPLLPLANLGECVGYVLTSEQGFASHDCDAFREIEPDLFYTIYDSYSECVRENKVHP